MYKRNYLFALFFVVEFGLCTGGSFAQMHDHGTMQSMGDSVVAKPSAFVTPAAFKNQIDTVYESYFSIQASLASDELQGAKSNALTLSKSFKNIGMKFLTDMKAHMAWMAVSEKLATDAGRIANAPDIKTARTEFKLASVNLIAIAKQFGTAGETGIYVFHCPMAFNNKGADWVQNEKTVKNPYFGKSMLSCGEITEIVGVKSEK